MKRILLLLCICAIICPGQQLFGAFLVKRTEVNSPAAVVHSKVTNVVAADNKTNSVSRFVHRLNMLLHMPHDPNTDIVNEKGLFGQLALIFGCLSFIPLYGILFGTAAIVFGFIGRHYHQKHSRVGILLGALGIIANGLFVSILIMEALGYVPFIVI